MDSGGCDVGAFEDGDAWLRDEDDVPAAGNCEGPGELAEPEEDIGLSCTWRVGGLRVKTSRGSCWLWLEM